LSINNTARMNPTERKDQLSDVLREVGGHLCPRRYRRFRDLRPWEEAAEWARTLDWRGNPYDRFLLRKEILRQLESTLVYASDFHNVYTYASREEIAFEVDRLLDELPAEFESRGPLRYVQIALPWHLAFKHGRVRHSRLAEALARFPQEAGR
jgi:hypothetical protein